MKLKEQGANELMMALLREIGLSLRFVLFFKKNNNANVPLSILFFGLIKNIVDLYGVADSVVFSFM